MNTPTHIAPDAENIAEGVHERLGHMVSERAPARFGEWPGTSEREALQRATLDVALHLIGKEHEILHDFVKAFLDADREMDTAGAGEGAAILHDFLGTHCVQLVRNMAADHRVLAPR